MPRDAPGKAPGNQKTHKKAAASKTADPACQPRCISPLRNGSVTLPPIDRSASQHKPLQEDVLDDIAQSRDASERAQQVATQWSLPLTTKNFSKALRHSIEQKLEAARSSADALVALDKHCRRIIHERVEKRTHDESRWHTPSPTPQLCHSPGSGDDADVTCDMGGYRSVSPEASSLRHFIPSERREAIRRRQAEEARKGDAARMRKEAMEQHYFEEVVRAHDTGPDAFAARIRLWRTIVKCFVYITATVDAAAALPPATVSDYCARNSNDGAADDECKRRAFWRTHDVRWLLMHGDGCRQAMSVVAVTPRSKEQQTCLAVGDALQVGTAPTPRKGWKLLRASIVLNWRYRLAKRNVATERILNMLEGAKRMAKFHRAMAVFRRKLLLCQSTARNHLSLQAVRRVVLEKSWTNAVRVYQKLLLDKFDRQKKLRASIAKAKEEAEKAARLEANEAIAVDLGSPDSVAAPLVFPSSGLGSAGVPAATFLLQENSFYFVPNATAAFQSSSIDIAFGGVSGSCVISDDFSNETQRRASRSAAVADESVWRPLEFKRRQSAALEMSMLRDAEIDKLKRIKSPTGPPSGTASPGSPTSSSLGGGGRDTTMIELVRCAEEAEFPARRVQNVVNRCWAFLRDINEMHAAQYRAQFLAYRFDLEQATEKRKRKNHAYTPLPKVPRPRFRKAVVPASVMLAFVKNEFDEHIMRSFSAQARTARDIVFPELPEATREELNVFRSDERRVQRWRRELEAEQRKRAEEAREVEPLLLPSVSRKDTMRVIIKPAY